MPQAPLRGKRACSAWGKAPCLCWGFARSARGADCAPRTLKERRLRTQGVLVSNRHTSNRRCQRQRRKLELANFAHAKAKPSPSLLHAHDTGAKHRTTSEATASRSHRFLKHGACVDFVNLPNISICIQV